MKCKRVGRSVDPCSWADKDPALTILSLNGGSYRR